MTASTRVIRPLLGPALLLPLFAAGCFAEPELCDADEVPIDSDGWPPGGCEAEICDGLDNDCDGLVDEGYPDADGDGVAECEPLPEVCDGVDNDFDGQVDEGFPDYDRDGVADCVDLACDTDGAAATTLPGPPVCGSGPITRDADFWNPTSTLIFQGTEILADGGFLADSAATPLVAHLIDSNEDGVVDTADQPQILFRSGYVNQSDGTVFSALFVADVTASTVHSVNWFAASARALSGIAVGDLTGDGTAEVLMVYSQSGRERVGALAHTGPPNTTPTSSAYFEWRSADELILDDEVKLQPVLADLDGDGLVEVIVHDLILNGEDGTTQATLSLSSSTPITMPSVGDIDLDGEQELVVGPIVFRADGSEYWSQNRVVGGEGQFSAIVQADADLEGEVAFVGGGRYALYEHDGTPIAEATLTTNSTTGPPCMADFDGDGTSEIAFVMASTLWMLELDGTEVWSTAVQDSGSNAGCSGFDFDNDGASELVLPDQDAVSILDGATGATHWTDTSHNSETMLEYAVVTDVDLDGSAEIVVGSNNGVGTSTAWEGLRVIGHPTDAWAGGGTSWPIHDYAYSNVTALNELPGPSNHYWDDWNLLRAAPGDPALPDLTVEIVDVCESGCEEFSAVQVSVQPFNQGSQDVAAGQATITVYGESSDGTRTALATEVYPDALPALSGGASMELVFTYGDYLDAGTAQLVVVIEKTTGTAECDLSNNEDVWPWIVCY